ncbi:MAG: hypothetical protein J7K83_03540 [Candidatus Aenigmarchaeota archaeon]|nr:hypothetical protein [Candidatus Aenigmarchaeota archaeon]
MSMGEYQHKLFSYSYAKGHKIVLENESIRELEMNSADYDELILKNCRIEYLNINKLSLYNLLWIEGTRIENVDGKLHEYPVVVYVSEDSYVPEQFMNELKRNSKLFSRKALE